jgi:hypothetical protein
MVLTSRPGTLNEFKKKAFQSMIALKAPLGYVSIVNDVPIRKKKINIVEKKTKDFIRSMENSVKIKKEKNIFKNLHNSESLVRLSIKRDELLKKRRIDNLITGLSKLDSQNFDEETRMALNVINTKINQLPKNNSVYNERVYLFKPKTFKVNCF